MSYQARIEAVLQEYRDHVSDSIVEVSPGVCRLGGARRIADLVKPALTERDELLQALKAATAHINDLRIILEQAAEMGMTLHMCGVTYNHEKALAVIAKAEGAQ